MTITIFSFLAQAAPAAAPEANSAQMMSTMIWFGAIMVIMWVLMIRPQQKKQKELLARIESLKTGDKVVTLGGIHGVVTNAGSGTTLTLRVDDGVKLTVDKSAISTIIAKENA